MEKLTVGLSTCPNDTFVFHALLSGKARIEGHGPLPIEPVFADVEELNRRALAEALDVTKISFHAWGHLRDRYRLLSSGAALGRGCGPLLVCREDALSMDLRRARVAIPGELTSAALLLRLYEPRLPAESRVVMTFDRILAAVASGEVDAGLIIHESRFTYREHGLVAREDLGRWWEDTHGHPIPLGGIIAHRRLGEERIRRIDEALRESVRHALAHPEDSRDFVRQHAQELSDEVTRAHIDLYVNRFTVDLGDEGRAAVDHLMRLGEESGVFARGGG